VPADGKDVSQESEVLVCSGANVFFRVKPRKEPDQGESYRERVESPREPLRQILTGAALTGVLDEIATQGDACNPCMTGDEFIDNVACFVMEATPPNPITADVSAPIGLEGLSRLISFPVEKIHITLERASSLPRKMVLDTANWEATVAYSGYSSIDDGPLVPTEVRTSIRENGEEIFSFEGTYSFQQPGSWIMRQGSFQWPMDGVTAMVTASVRQEEAVFPEWLEKSLSTAQE